jgi:nucleotide-binding universal stress UspA family protein
MRKIVLGFDSSDQAGDALALARAFRDAAGAELIVVSVEDLDPLFADTPIWQQQADAQRHRDFERAAESLGEGGFARRTAIGSVPRALNLVAEDEDADLIIVGSTHRGTVGRVMPGAVGDRLLAGAPCAVAIAPLGYREHEHPPVRRIGVAFNGEPEAKYALHEGVELAQTFDAELRVIGVVPTLDLELPERIGPTKAGYRDVLRGRFKQLLDDVVAAFSGRVSVTQVLLEGDPARELADQGVELDLLVMGSRGYGPVRRTLLGGVARDVVTLAPCPVVVLPRSAGKTRAGSNREPDGNSAVV